jgi:hypothetical protein
VFRLTLLGQPGMQTRGFSRKCISMVDHEAKSSAQRATRSMVARWERDGS